MARFSKISYTSIWLVLATVPDLDPAGVIGLRGNGLTPSKIDDFLREQSHQGHKYSSESLVFGTENMQLHTEHLWESLIFDILKSQPVVA